MRILAELFCFSIAFAVQAGFVWIAANVVRLDCRFKEAAIIALVCALLLIIPKVGLLLSCATFFVLFMTWLRADLTDAILAFLVNCILGILLIFTRVV